MTRPPTSSDSTAVDGGGSRLPPGLRDWVNAGGQGADEDLNGYFEGVSRARYVVRRIFRIFDEEAGGVGLEPLQHQALIQVCGREAVVGVRVSSIAEWLDIPPALASRLVRDLREKGLVERRSSDADGRVTLVVPTSHGRELLARISRAVHSHVAYFQSQLTQEDRSSALAIFAFYVGVPLDDSSVEALELLAERATQNEVPGR